MPLEIDGAYFRKNEYPYSLDSVPYIYNIFYFKHSFTFKFDKSRKYSCDIFILAGNFKIETKILFLKEFLKHQKNVTLLFAHVHLV